jgi:4-aminobutyrate aminotransferase-like enzyme
MEYFNTFGGNPVSCAVGRAVLQVIHEEGLQRRALEVGGALRSGIAALAAEFPLIGDVRGEGLYLGAELVLDPEARSPAGGHAAYVANRMRDRGFLISTDGPEHNVLKIKPPLQFGLEDVSPFLDALRRTLEEEPARIG